MINRTFFEEKYFCNKSSSSFFVLITLGSKHTLTKILKVIAGIDKLGRETRV